MKKIGAKKIIIGVVVLIVGFLVYSNLSPKKMPKPKVEVSTLEKGQIESIVEVQGNVTAEDSAEITSSYNYEVVKINVKEGDKVEKGQILAQLDSGDLKNEIILLENDIKYEEQRLSEAYDMVNDIYSSTQSLELSKDNAKIILDNAKKTLEDKKALLEAGAIASIEYEQASTSYEQAKISYEQSQEALERGKHDIQKQIENATPKASTLTALETKKISLQQKREKLEKLNISSPISGTVTRVYAKLGRMAQGDANNRAMFIIEDESKKYITAKIGEYSISKIKLNQEVQITADVLGQDSAKGIIDRISPTGEKSQSSNSIVIPVKILITQSDDRLITGVNAKARIKIQSLKDIYKVPFEMIVTKNDKNYVYVVQDNKLKEIEVKIGIESDLETQILSDELKEGMSIVKNPQETFTDAQEVELIGENNQK